MSDDPADRALVIARSELVLGEQRIVKLKELIAEAKAHGERAADLQDELTSEVIAQLDRRLILRRLEDGTRH
jgi:hypothetical protein